MHFGSTLRLFRVDAGMSLRSLAREVGVSSAYLSRIENGHDPPPTPTRLAAIASALEVPAAMLIELANQTGAAIADYVERVPAANAFFLEVARRDLDAAQLARLHEVIETELARPDPAPLDQPRLSAVLGDRLVLGVDAASIDDVIEAAVPRCVSGSADAANVARKIREREGISPTALGQGVVVPHAIIEGAPTAIALVTCARPLSQNGPVGLPIDTAFVLISGQAGRPHLEILARIAQLANRGISRALRSVATVRQARRIVEQIEAS